MTERELVGLILEARQAEKARTRKGGRPDPPYYMLNINHPALGPLYREWRAKNRLAHEPPTDQERTAWELSLLTADAKRAIARAMGEKLVLQSTAEESEEKNNG